MKHLAWIPVAYLALTAFANLSPGTLGTTITGLPDIGTTFFSQTGTTAAAIDLAAAAGIYFLVIH